jgi:ABC-type multidrug transport system ATPase subunit
MIKTLDLRKRFTSKSQAVVALDGVDLEINEGEVFGILGPNGAGKTTFFRLLSCLLRPTSGTAEVSGYDIVREPMKVRESVGLLCEEPSLYDKQSVADNLDLFGALYGMGKSGTTVRIKELASLLGFQNLLNKKTGTLSKGQRQKVSLARALLHEPDVLLLDEPTANLDPEVAENVRNSIKTLQRDDSKKRTILVSSHNLDEVQRLCGRVAIIDEGRVVKSGSVEDLSNKLWSGRKKVSISLKSNHIVEKGEQRWMDDVKKSFPLVTSISLIPTLQAISTGESPHYSLEIEFPDSTTEEEQEDAISEMIRMISASKDLRITSVEKAKHSLQDVYLKLLHDKDAEEKEREEGTVAN